LEVFPSSKKGNPKAFKRFGKPPKTNKGPKEKKQQRKQRGSGKGMRKKNVRTVGDRLKKPMRTRKKRVALLLVLISPFFLFQKEMFCQAKPKLLSKVQDQARAKAKALSLRIQETPKNRDLHLERIRVLMSAELIEDALDALDQSHRVFKKDFDLLRWTSKAFLQKAKKLIAHPKSRDGAMVDFEDAMVFADRALELKPNDFECLRMRGFAAYYLGEDDHAISTADILIGTHGNKADGFLLRAETLFRQYTNGVQSGELKQNSRKALVQKIRQDLKQAIKCDKNLSLPYRRLADLSAWEGNIKVALGFYLQALIRDPKKGAPIAWLRKTQTSEDRLKLFLAAQKGFSLRHPKDPKASILLFEAGFASFELQNNKQTRDLMKKAWTLDPSLDLAAYYFAISSLVLNKQKDASLALSYLLRESPHPLVQALKAAGNPGVYHANSLAALAKQADKKGALALSRELNHALGIFRNLPEEWNNYAFLCRETGKYEEAWRAYQKALDLSPKDPQILNDAALILQYHLHRDLPKARKMYLEAIAFGKKVLASKNASWEEKKRAKGSVRDATANLAKMEGRPEKRKQVKPKGKGKKN
jgi:tetratricopeptide (TPR) repeat protein